MNREYLHRSGRLSKEVWKELCLGKGAYDIRYVTSEGEEVFIYFDFDHSALNNNPSTKMRHMFISGYDIGKIRVPDTYEDFLKLVDLKSQEYLILKLHNL